ncbi:2-keto-4-pentenoate hydratase [Ilumatobacter sp.]|uniref:2-keto-4-pentenoate hydratase n=1 Tax=Ilumatobacter sp. TaxID=1967498 RepID=UPI003AF754C2
MDDRQLRAAADELIEMRRTRRVEPDLPSALRPTTLDEAYAVQDLLVDGLLPDDGRRIGYKVACTSEIAQDALRIDGPLFGQLLSHTTSPSGVTLAADGFVHRVIEAEFGFRIGSDVSITGRHTRDSIAAHIDAVIPAIEIVDYRYESWTVGALPVAADNAIHGWWVRGDPVTEWRHLDLGAASVEVRRNDEVVTSGSGSAVLGHPLTVMVWLADELARRGRPLVAGDVVTTGVTTDVFEAAAGDHVEAVFEGVGAVEISMV